MKNILFSILTLGVIVLGVYMIQQQKVTAPAPQQVAAEMCGLTITSPLPATTVTFPLTIQAVVDNTQAGTLGCSWTVFEAQAGTVTVKDQNGAILGTGILSTTNDWMTTAPTPYTATITSLTNPTYTGPLSLVFNEENPGDLPNPDSLTVSVVK